MKFRKVVTPLLVGVSLGLTLAADATPASFDIGNAHYAFTDRRFAGVFDQTLILGHTLSADFMIGMISRSVGAGTVLAEHYAGRSVLANLAEPRTMSTLELGVGAAALTRADCAKADVARPAVVDRACEVLLNESRWARFIRKFRAKLPLQIGLETGLSKIFRLVHQIDDPATPSHRLDFMNRVYATSTAIVGIDALYLDATESFNTCADIDVAKAIDDFVARAHRDGKITVLGNVPKENYASFTLLNRLAIYPQVESCRREINAGLAAACTPERNCYVVDLEAIVADLGRDGYLTLNDGTRLSGVQTRPDGVNLSNRGTQFVVEKILAALAAHPPRPVDATGPGPR